MSRALINPVDLPTNLRKCFEMKTKYSNVKEVPSEDICLTCITDYLWRDGKHAHCSSRPHTADDLKWVADILVDIHPTTNNRYRRSTFERARRKEYRMLSDEEREQYHLAVNMMKKDTSVLPNRYDAFVEFHGREAGKSAHRGPNFMGWHRILLVMYEYSLNLQVKGVTLPYWDSTLDSGMSIDPVNSIIWSDQFLGNGDGDVRTGPFKNWRVSWNNTDYKLVRNIGSTGQLYTKNSVLNILSQRYNRDIVEPSYYPRNSLEGLHDRVHFWIGGNMFNLATAPMDPIFFMHHAFVDLIWELFRQQQRTYYKIDPSQDYPHTFDPLHHPDREMDGIPAVPGGQKLRNKDGYLDYWTDRVYFYDPPPTCSKFTLDCNSRYLECDPVRVICVSKSIQAMSFQYPTFNSFNAMDFWKRRGKRDTLDDLYGHVDDFVSSSQISYEKIQLNVPKELILGSPVQNTFNIDCERPDVKTWAFMAIKIIHIRPPEVKLSAHIIEDGVTKDRDLYNESNYRSLRTHIKPGSPATYSNCQEDKSGAFRVSITSFGLSYSGWFEDYVVVDNRLPISSHIGYIAFKKPHQNDKEVMVFLTATDTCGRMCKPRCLQKNAGSKPTYVPCSGVIKATDDLPLMYSESYGDAVRDVWDFSDPATPESKENNISMIFYCDYSDSWPWEGCSKGCE